MTDDHKSNPDKGTVGVDAETLFHSLIGQAISSWAFMETCLVAVASLVLRTTTRKVGVIFYSIQNMHVWLNIFDELFTLDRVSAKHREEWLRISKRLRKLNDTRVRLAHHTSLHKDRDRANPTLRPARLDYRAKSKAYDGLDADQILDFNDELIEVVDSITKLLEALDKDLAPYFQAISDWATKAPKK